MVTNSSKRVEDLLAVRNWGDTSVGQLWPVHRFAEINENRILPVAQIGRNSPSAIVKRALVTLAALALPSLALGEILWSGDFETGDFLQWHLADDDRTASYWQVPKYGRPKRAENESSRMDDSYYGDGSLLEIVTTPVREGRYAAKFRVKNSKNGVEQQDCDYPFPTCSRRRTELTVQQTLPRYYNAMPYMSERWISISHFVPEDWSDDGSGWGPNVFQIKPLNEHGLSPNFAILVEDSAWTIMHRWSDVVNPEGGSIPWQQQMFYAGNYDGSPYPNSGSWPDGLADFPNVQTSHAALASLNKGGWTDWVIHTKFDARGAGSGGSGFITVWKREDAGPWIMVLNVTPKRTTRGGMTFDHGIGYNSPASGSNPGGFGIKVGMYMAKEQVWGLTNDRVIVIDNVKVGSQNASLEMMSPGGSGPEQEPVSEPNPPAMRPVE